MCFDTCVAVDPTTGSKHIPASARIDPSLLPFHPAVAANDSQVKLTVLHLGTIHSYRQAWADDVWDEDVERRKKKAAQRVQLPVLSALIEHEPSGEKWLWDLGMSNDSNVLPKIFSRTPVGLLDRELNDHGQLQNVLLKKFGVDTVDEIGLAGIVLSHAHVDHYGNLLDFPTSVPVYVGPGTMDWVGGGEDAVSQGGKGLITFPSSFLTGRTFVELDQIDAKSAHGSRLKKTKIGPFDQAWDWFGDGSLFLASAEGHCPGHLVLLAKTSAAPPTYVVLGGDAAHQQALYHPLPAPLELGAESLCSAPPHRSSTYQSQDDLRATPGYFDRASGEAVLDRPIPQERVRCMQEFPDKAMRTLAALSRLEACHDVMVVLAHELEFTQALGLREGDSVVVNDWRNKGWKENKIEMGKRARDQLASL